MPIGSDHINGCFKKLLPVLKLAVIIQFFKWRKVNLMRKKGCPNDWSKSGHTWSFAGAKEHSSLENLGAHRYLHTIIVAKENYFLGDGFN